MVCEGILGHKVSSRGILVDSVKVDFIKKFPLPTSVKGVQSFIGHPRFYRRFIQDFSKITSLLRYLLVKDVPFKFDEEWMRAFNILKGRLILASVIVSPNWEKEFELMYDASDYAIGVVLSQRQGKVFHTIYYVSKVLTGAQLNYATTENEMLAIVYALEK